MSAASQRKVESSSSRIPMRVRFGRAFGLARDAWLILGIAIILLLVLEGAYRIQGSLRRSVRTYFHPETQVDYPRAAPFYPYADSTWFEGWVDQRDAALRDAWVYHPYRGWAMRGFAVPGITVGPDGLRAIPGGTIGSGRDTVYLLGGSAIWGFESRDSGTVGAFAAGGLRDRGIDNVTLVSLAQVGYNLTQEIAALTERLRAGQRPAVVVFVDGVNEVGHFVEGDPLWGVYGQRLIERRIALGKRTAMEEVLGFGHHSELVSRIGAALNAGPPRGDPAPVATCDTVGQRYAASVRMVEALGSEFGFAPVFVWQPTLATTGKPLSYYEGYRLRWEAQEAWHIAPLLERCSAVVDSLMGLRPRSRYHGLGALYDRDTVTVFLDGYGHLTLWGSALLGDSIAGLVDPVLVAARASRR